MAFRALTAAERALCEAMIHNAPAEAGPVSSADRARWLSHLDEITVWRECGCGTCPSVDFAFQGAPVESHRPTILEAYTNDDIMLMLFIDSDAPASLEVVPPGDEPVLLPAPDALEY